MSSYTTLFLLILFNCVPSCEAVTPERRALRYNAMILFLLTCLGLFGWFRKKKRRHKRKANQKKIKTDFNTDSPILQTESRIPHPEPTTIQTESLVLQTIPTTSQTESPIPHPEPSTSQTESPVLHPEPSTSQTESPVLHPEPSTSQTESPVLQTIPVKFQTEQTESPILQTEPSTIQTESTVLQTELSTSQTESPVFQTERSTSQTESPVLQTEPSTIQTESPVLQTEPSTSQTESTVLQTELSTSQTESPTLQNEPQLKEIKSGNNNYYYHLYIFLGVIADVLREKFHIKFSRDPKTLFKELEREQEKINGSKEKKNKPFLYKDQLDLLFPTTGETDSRTFDITLLAILLRYFCGYNIPNTKFKDWGKLDAKESEESKM
ncbi:zonadhesin-like isoform X2 [Clytia hemisphaerica]|uniref:zonadhesin-like isoform X2 n=1 Tax=Clytia hemisphaerica TaxID=252671 RepID=UPI0034D57856